MPKVKLIDTAQADIGDVVAFAMANPGPNFLICDGTEVSKTTYAALFAKIGTTYGVAVDPLKFKLPDMRGRTPIGTGQGAGLTNRVLGVIGGVETVSISNSPQHTHSGTTDTAPDHQHTYTRTNNGSTYATYASPVVQAQTLTTDGADGSHSHTFTSASQGLSQAHENMHPMVVVQFAIAYR